ncbi:MAG: PBP1A family penicillin-binding protein [Geminicoccaceae bacterium]
MRRPPPGRRPGTLPAKAGRTASPRRRGSALGFVWRLGLFGVVALLVAWVALFYVYAPILPDPQALRDQSRQKTITVLADNGAVLAVRGMEGEPFVDLDEISPWLVKAVVATEDRRFLTHFGIDLQGLVRAAWTNLRAGGVVEGGSTITQQLAKNLFLTPERSMQRKLQELVIAIWLETQLKKAEILALYLNRVYLGAGAYGVEAASRRYFAKPAKDLNLPEAAMIAGLLKAPSRLAPTGDYDLAEERASIVLARMEDAGFIDAAAAAAARAKPAKVAPDSQTRLAGWFVDWVLEDVRAQLGPTGRDLVVRTTLEPALQRTAEATLARRLDAKAIRRGASEAAIVLMDEEGAVRAMVGGTDYHANAFNRAIEARRQPGSAFKPFVYVTALQSGYTPESVMEDRPISIKGWRPQNHDGRYAGQVTLDRSFAASINTVAVQLAQALGPANVVATARRYGITSPLEPVPSLALGTSEVTLLELTSAYLPFATGGIRRPEFGVLEVTDGKGNLLYRHQKVQARVADPRIAAQVQQLMVTAVENGTGRAALLPDRRVGGKTGTTQNARDAWFVGFAGDYVAGVWVGNDEGKPMQGVSGGTLPAQIWREVMAGTPKPESTVVAAREPVPSAKPNARGGGFDWLLDLIGGVVGRATN